MEVSLAIREPWRLGSRFVNRIKVIKITELAPDQQTSFFKYIDKHDVETDTPSLFIFKKEAEIAEILLRYT